MKTDSNHWKLGPLEYARVGAIAVMRWGSTEFWHRIADCVSLKLGHLTYVRQGDLRAVHWGALLILHYAPGWGWRLRPPTN